ncbi:MAG: ATP-binding cassette domain-containing protein [Myxococcota bacterium]
MARPSETATLHVRGLEVHYPHARVGPLDLACDAGLVRIDGPNGAGKTSLLRAITAGIRRSAGTVALDGRDPETCALTRGRIGYVPAQPELPGFLTIDEAWRLMADLRRTPTWDGTSIREALDLPGDLRLDHASTGMRRKAEVVAALAGDPVVLILDETLANLDARGRDWLVAHLEVARSDHVVVITHHGACPIEPDWIVTLG